jgi:uncharacterized membrane protein
MFIISITETIGRWHPLLVHLPIGILLIGLLLQALSHKPKLQVTLPVLKIIFLCGIGGALLSCITGFCYSVTDTFDDVLLSLHMWLGIGLTLIAMLLYVKIIKGQRDALYKATVIALLLFIILAGYLGGQLGHGTAYLTEGIQPK